MGKNYLCKWNRNNVKKAVVFIHGFNGSTMETFGDFNLDFRFRDEYKNYDVYFYGYDSLFTQISNSGVNFLNFLRAIHNDINGS